jgi:hypothetical protein
MRVIGAKDKLLFHPQRELEAKNTHSARKIPSKTHFPDLTAWLSLPENAQSVLQARPGFA